MPLYDHPDKVPEGWCQEAHLIMAKEHYFPCGKPAERMMKCSRDNYTYRMCLPCAQHNTTRGMVDIGPYKKEKKLCQEK